MIQRLIDFLETYELRPIDEEFLRSLGPTIMEVARNPESNWPAAVVLLLIAVTMVLLVLSAVALAVLRPHEDTDDYEYEYILVEDTSAYAEQSLQPLGENDAPRREPSPDRLRYHRAVLWGIGPLIVLLLTAGVSSQTREVCLTCHDDIAHTALGPRDPHRSMRCTSCHESANALVSATIAVPARMAHIFSALRVESGGGYGHVAGSTCRRCHSAVTAGVILNRDRALRMSHREPLEAGAGCLHCHRLDASGVLARETEGMAACLRCHNDEQTSAECSICHTDDNSLAHISTVEHEPRQIIARPDCYSCHEPAGCDACHGARLPHAPDYRMSHMMDAARDLWFDEGRTCFACHTPQRNSCYQAGCHRNELDFHRREDPDFPRTHWRDPRWTCDSCHVQAADFGDPCAMCHQDN